MTRSQLPLHLTVSMSLPVFSLREEARWFWEDQLDFITRQGKQHQHNPPISEIRLLPHGAGHPRGSHQLSAVNSEGE